MRKWVIYLKEGWYANHRPAAPLTSTDHHFSNEASIIAGTFFPILYVGRVENFLFKGEKKNTTNFLIFQSPLNKVLTVICQSRTVIIIYSKRNPKNLAIRPALHRNHGLYSLAFNDKCPPPTFCIITLIHGWRSLQSDLACAIGWSNQAYCRASCGVRSGHWRVTHTVWTEASVWRWPKEKSCCVQVIMGDGTLGFCSCDLEAFNARRHQTAELPHVAAPFALWMNVFWHECSTGLTNIFTASCTH